MMQTPVITLQEETRGLELIQRLLTSPVSVAVEVDEEDADPAHQTHEGAQRTSVLSLCYLHDVSRSR